MVHRIQDLIERFPEDIKAIGALIAEDREFDRLCDEFKEINNELHELAGAKTGKPALHAEELRMRRVAVEEEILTKIEGYKPI